MKIILRDTSMGRSAEWVAEVTGNKVVQTWGKIGCTMQSEAKVYSEGKNIGKANETTPEQQCLMDTQAKIRKKIEKGYQVVGGDWKFEDAPVETTSNLEIPKPMLANTLQDHMKKLVSLDIVYVQPKLDGNRALVNIKTGRMFSRNRKEIAHLGHIPTAVVKACGKLLNEHPDVEWIDGELYSPNMSFNQIQTLIRRVSEEKQDEEAKRKLYFYLFDVIMDKPFSEREQVMKLVVPNEHVVIVPSFSVGTDQIDAYHDNFILGGFEGVMVRFPGTGYEQKRSLGLFKYKKFLDDEFVVVGFEPEKHDPAKLGSVTVMDKGGATFNARPAMPDPMKDQIWAAKEAYMGKLATIKFQNRDEKSGIPRFPVLIRFRDESDVA